MVHQRGAPGRHEGHIVRQAHRQVVVGQRHRPARLAVHHGDGASPIALARQQPVAQPVVGLALADALFFQPVDGSGLGLVHQQTVQPIAVDGRPVAGVGLAVEVVGGLNGANDGQTVGNGEVPVALVLAGHGHDRPGAVGGEHIVGQEQRDRLAGEWVDHPGAGVHSPLVGRSTR